MRLPKSVRDNLSFLLAETSSQVANLQVLLDTSSSTVAQRILDRRGYTYNLKMRIHDASITTLREGKKGDANIFSLRAAEAIASDLERLTDHCHECVELMGGLVRQNALRKRGVPKLLKEIAFGLELIEKAVENDDTRLTLKLGNIERKLDRAYEKVYADHRKELRRSKSPDDVIISLFVAQRIEEMGDVMLAISESIMSAQLGHPMHIDRFRSLKTALSDLGLIDAEVEPIAETKSGSGISGISNGEGDGYVAIFKDGKKEKMLEEVESVESWHDIYPGLAPQILKYKKQGKNASLLIEHLPGQTFEQILLSESDELLGKTLKHLTKTLKAVWSETRRKKIVKAGHMAQLQKRLPSVLEVHPEFERQASSLCGATVKSLDQLIADAARLEDKIDPAYSVYIHGDFNLDNIIFDPESKKIRFIDLHRSDYSDYTQDVSVFMVSNYRLQVLKRKTRQRIQQVAVSFHDFAAAHAARTGAKTFEIRLALGLARSFITSTRFILDKTLATNMFLRGVYILERLQSVTPKTQKSFRLPIEELFE